MSKCSRHHCQYHYHASAYGFAAEIERPVQQSLHAQAASALSGSGGHGSNRVESVSLPPFISFDAAHSEVGGSFDPCHNVHTTYTHSVIEGLNIGDVVTADRVVSRLTIYSPEIQDDGCCRAADPEEEHVFDITGSHFENLQIAGHGIEIELAAKKLQAHQTFTDFENTFTKAGAEDLLPWGKQSAKRLDELENYEDDYHVLMGVGQRAKQWQRRKEKRGAYSCSPAGHLNISDQLQDWGLDGFGSIILIPKFGVVRLAQLVVTRNHRHLKMIDVQMCSPGYGGGGTGSGGGGSYPYP